MVRKSECERVINLFYFLGSVELFRIPFRFNKRSKNQERQVLEQGITLPPPPQTTCEPLPSTTPLGPSCLPTPQIPNTFPFHFPPNTAGEAKTRRPILPVGCPLMFVQSQPTSPQTSTSTPGAQSTKPLIPRSTLSYRKRRDERQFAGETRKRYKERSGLSKCSKCGQPRIDGHIQYYGNWFCPTTSVVSYEEWKADFVQKKAYKKKKQRDLYVRIWWEFIFENYVRIWSNSLIPWSWKVNCSLVKYISCTCIILYLSRAALVVLECFRWN